MKPHCVTRWQVGEADVIVLVLAVDQAVRNTENERYLIYLQANSRSERRHDAPQ